MNRAEEVWAAIMTHPAGEIIDLLAAYGAECRAQGVRDMRDLIKMELSVSFLAAHMCRAVDKVADNLLSTEEEPR